MRRALVTLAHPQHAGMLRALRVLDDAAPRARLGAAVRLPARAPAARRDGHPRRADRRSSRGSARWRRHGRARGSPATSLRLARLARGADVLYSTTLSTLPALPSGGSARAPPAGGARVLELRRGPRPYRKHWLGRARHVIAPSADSLRAGGARGRRLPPRACAPASIYNGMDVAPDRRGRPRRHRPRAWRSAAGRGSAWWATSIGGRTRRCSSRRRRAIRAAVPEVRVAAGRRLSRRAPARRRCAARIAALGLDDVVTVTGFLSNPFPVVRALDVVGASGASRSVSAGAARGPGARPAHRGVGRGRDSRDAGGRRERRTRAAERRCGAGGRGRRRCCETSRGAARMGAAGFARLETEFTLPGFARDDVRRLRRRRAGRSGMTPEVAVVVPTFNRAAHVAGESRQPARARGRRPSKWWSSTTAPPTRRRRCWPRCADPRLRVLRVPHGGIAAARNAGHRGGAHAATSPSTTPTTWRCLAGSRCRSRCWPSGPSSTLVIQNGRMLAARGRPARPRGALDPTGGGGGAGRTAHRGRRGVPLEPGSAPGDDLPPCRPRGGRPPRRVVSDSRRSRSRPPGRHRLARGLPRRPGVRVPAARGRCRAGSDARARGVDPPGRQAGRPSTRRCSRSLAPRPSGARQARRWAGLAAHARARRATPPRRGRHSVGPAASTLRTSATGCARSGGCADRPADADRVHASPARGRRHRGRPAAHGGGPGGARSRRARVLRARPGRAGRGRGSAGSHGARRAGCCGCCRSPSRRRGRWRASRGTSWWASGARRGRTSSASVAAPTAPTCARMEAAGARRRRAGRIIAPSSGSSGACSQPTGHRRVYSRCRSSRRRGGDATTTACRRTGSRCSTTASTASASTRGRRPELGPALAGGARHPAGGAAVCRDRHRIRAARASTCCWRCGGASPPADAALVLVGDDERLAAWRREAAEPRARPGASSSRDRGATSRRSWRRRTWCACRRGRRRSATSCSKRAPRACRW